ncbi:hypothetical protein [Methylorubrum populi]|uniref:Uncharacterized protein n=1 Tax=Methylorubrum populi TaxID=223967 RepID=A0A833J0S5_9HYPH|nr:hypothetical protein [Methylorubrum populi]KAB7782585.1 hypothetical protein F8B43_5340 [Methylorubrum populi]
MRRLLSFALAALNGLAAASSQAHAGEYGRRLVARPAVTALPPEMPYRDPHPRFRAPPVARFAVRAYVPRPTNQPMFNEPPQPLR